MPSPDKDRPSGRLGRLLAALRPSRAGPLPVQTGFPTSLADLVVKNHGRLKKQPSPSSKRRKGGASASPSPPSPSPSPPPSSPPPPPPPPAAAVSPSDRPRPDLAPVQAVRREKSDAFGFGLGFLAFSGAVSLALLVIWSKKVVAAVTVASFSLFLLESLRSSSLRRRRQRPRPQPEAAERQLCLDGRGRVSPIREVEAETEPARPRCSDSDRGIEASVLANEEKSGVLDESSDPKAKTKKRSWKKLIASAKKLHKGRKGKEADGSGSFRSEGGRADAMAVGSFRIEGDHADATARGNVAATDFLGSRRGVANQTDVVEDAIANAPADLIEQDVAAAEEAAAEEEQGKAGFPFPALVLVAIVLVGLVAGKLPAVAFTMLCAAFFSWVRRLRYHGGGSQWRRLELPVP